MAKPNMALEKAMAMLAFSIVQLFLEHPVIALKIRLPAEVNFRAIVMINMAKANFIASNNHCWRVTFTPILFQVLWSFSASVMIMRLMPVIADARKNALYKTREDIMVRESRLFHLWLFSNCPYLKLTPGCISLLYLRVFINTGKNCIVISLVHGHIYMIPRSSARHGGTRATLI